MMLLCYHSRFSRIFTEIRAAILIMIIQSYIMNKVFKISKMAGLIGLFYLEELDGFGLFSHSPLWDVSKHLLNYSKGALNARMKHKISLTARLKIILLKLKRGEGAVNYDPNKIKRMLSYILLGLLQLVQNFVPNDP